MIISERMKGVFERENWILGGEVVELEERIADYTNRFQSVACGSGADALYLALDAAGMNEMAVVITTPFTFGATVSAILRTGAWVSFCDIGEDLQIDHVRLNDIFCIRKHIGAVVTVDLFGGMPNYGAIQSLCWEHKVKLIEDAAQAFGAEYDGLAAGSFGNFGCFSFHPSKPLGAIGDAGMVVTDDEKAAQTMRVRRNHGQAEKYHYTEAGINSRMDSIQAAAILDNLDSYDAELKRRRALAKVYRDKIEGVRHPIQDGGIRNPSFSIYPVIFETREQRDKAQAAITKAGLWSRVYYPTTLHLQPAFEFLGYKRGSLPRAERAAETILALPMAPGLLPEDLDRLAEIIGGVVRK